LVKISPKPRFEEKDQTLHMKKANFTREKKLKHQFYEQLPLQDVSDILRFVHQRCQFFSVFTHIQPRYSKLPPDVYPINLEMLVLQHLKIVVYSAC